MAPQAKKKDLLERARAFVGRRKSIIDRDLEDLTESRAFGSGFGFSKKDRALRGDKGRAETTTNVTRPWFNGVLSSYNANPFTIGIRRYDGASASDLAGIIDYQVAKSRLDDVAAQVLEDVLNDGYGYFLVDTAYDNPSTKTQYARPIHLDNGRTFFDACESPTGADCKMAVYVDLILKDTAEQEYDISRRDLARNSDPFAEIAYYGKNSADYTSIATIYELTQKGCEVSTMVHGRQVGETVLFPGLTRLPIVRCAAEKVFLESEEQWTYRGAYWYVFSLVKKVNYEMSAQTEAVATRPLAKFLAPRGSFTGISDQLSDMHKTPRLFLEYNNTDESGVPLPAPTPYGESALATGLMDDVEKTTSMITAILGSPAAEAPANETATATLLKKGTQEATVSRFLKALKDSLEEVGRVMLDMSPSLFTADRVADGRVLHAVMDSDACYAEISNGPMAQSMQQRSIAVLMSLSEIIAANPANPTIPLIIRNSELSQEDKDMLIQSLAPKGPGEIPPEVQQAMAEKDAQMAQMQQALQEYQKNVAQLQQALFEYQRDSQAMILKAQMEIESKERIEMMRLQAQGVALDQELMAESRMQTQKLMVDYQKTIAKASMEASRIETPLFTSSKFTG